jgi:N-acetylglucosaminyldiphosphoundecaprenol N-acetyl-beta-D-mannosaminyltransferase
MELFRQWFHAETVDLHHVVTVNPEFIMAAKRDDEFREVLRDADLATADGVGVVFAARVVGERIRERLTGVDLSEALASMTSPAPNIFLLGAGPGVADAAVDKLVRKYPGVSISGTYGGSPRHEEAGEILQRIGSSGANTLLVAFGAPAQEKWIAEHLHDLAACGIVLAIGVGGAFDYLAGNVPRAPRIIRRMGLEWLYRLVRQPWRWRRQLALPQFVFHVLRKRLSRRYAGSTEEHVDFKH